jgi:hypothetical protein
MCKGCCIAVRKRLVAVVVEVTWLACAKPRVSSAAKKKEKKKKIKSMFFFLDGKQDER